MKELNIWELKAEEIEDAASLVGRGMRDNPNNVQAFRQDQVRRERVLTRMFLPVLRRTHAKGSVLGAFGEGKMVGVCAMTPPGLCQLKSREKLRIAPSIFSWNSVGAPTRVLRWTAEWSQRDPNEPHWHLGPVAVDPQFQGQGIGSAMLAEFCARMDRRGGLSYLETDKSENVHFYQRFGFTLTAKSEILGVPNWFMSRPGL